MRYTVYEETQGSLNTVLKTDCIIEAREAYKKCWGYQRGAGGIWDNNTPKGGYGWIA